jgi:hypothetical protein
MSRLDALPAVAGPSPAVAGLDPAAAGAASVALT